MNLPSVIRKQVTIEQMASRRGIDWGRCLNIGSKDTHYGPSCFNLDVQPGPGVDLVADAQQIPADLYTGFDTAVLSAVLQYCQRPGDALHGAWQALKPGGWVFIDAPFLQPVCPDTPDLYRFTADGLHYLLDAAGFVDITIMPSIALPSALAFQVQQAHEMVPTNRWFWKGLGLAVSVLAQPAILVPWSQVETAGAFLAVARRPVAE
ncbi:MAG: methyltransferase domain-containing protein [Gemmatimonadota bacterium]